MSSSERSGTDNGRWLENDFKALKSLYPFLWPKNDLEVKIRVVVALLAIVGSKVANVFVPYFLKLAVDSLDGGPLLLPIWIIVAYGSARLISLTFAQVRDAVFAKVGARAIRKSALSVLEHLHKLSLKFHLDRQTGGLSRSIERGTTAIQSLLSITLFNLFPTLFEVGLVTIILWGVFDGWYAFVTFFTVISYVAFTAYTTEWRIKFRREMNRLDNKANTRAIDSLLNYETVKAFGNEKLEAREYDAVMAEYEQASVRTQVSLALLNIGQAVIIAFGLTVLMLMAGYGVVDGSMTQGDFVMINTYMLQLAQPLNLFGFVYRNVKQALVDLEKMFALLDQKPDVIDSPNAVTLSNTKGQVFFDSVSFGYNDSRAILSNVSFEVSRGNSVAIVGPTGSGKSTIARLLFRLYDISSGKISIDGKNITEISQDSLRASIGVVSQDTVLFNNSIGYNLSYANPSASQSQIDEAVRLSHLEGFINSLPDGYDTLVGERGLKLSGGEKQRIAIARVILKDTPILLFDEATSALDTRTEKEIQKNLSQISSGRTTIIIAHRLSTIVDADEILFLDSGKIIERGSHQVLIADKGAYHAAWTRQQKSLLESGQSILKDSNAKKFEL